MSRASSVPEITLGLMPVPRSTAFRNSPPFSASRTALVAAATIEDAREHFGALSTILVPKFQEAGIDGARAYYCGMKKLSWMQRGDKVENPYYGKSMLACGEPLKATRNETEEG